MRDLGFFGLDSDLLMIGGLADPDREVNKDRAVLKKLEVVIEVEVGI